MQLAPRDRPTGPDDPREPWSPNYGTIKPTARDAGQFTTQVEVAAVPTPPPVLRVIARPVDPDDIIRRAIAEHEMRQR